MIEGNVVRNEDICGVQNGRRLYLELGEKGILYAKNVSMVRNEARKGEGSLVYTSNSSHAQCSLELVTCPSCVIIVTFQTIALSHHCGDGTITMDSPCRCDYVWISEPPYEDVSGTPFCGLYAPITYRSSTRTLSITLFYSQSHMHAFTLEYTAERNRLHLKGTELTGQAAKGLNNTGGGILTSPFFPARYPRDLGLEYVVICPNEASSCRIRLLFSDFQLATVSIMEFYDWNGQRLDVSSGARFRPPVIMSSGPSLLIRFYANGGTGLGYKAFYSFVIGHSLDKSVKPITDCGGYVENLGGAITMMDMVGEGVKTYDCVWLIRPPKNFLHLKTHMYLKVITFADMAGNTELVVKQGPTSALLPLEILRHPVSQVQPPRYREHVAPVASGFHVSLRGTFGPSSHLAIAYAAFSYMDCFAGSDFLCRNHRCIPSQLNCDGFDHCGDNSDEPATCFRDWEMEDQAEDRKWHANKANYYFPKIDRYPDLKTATLVFVASSLGLIILISALIILLYRMGARARQQRELQSRLQTISELLDGARIDEISVTDDPPVYEAPPGYDEVVKLGFDSEMIGRKKRRMFRGRNSPSSLQGSSSEQYVERCFHFPRLEVGGGRSSVCSIIEAGTSSSNQDSEIPTKNRAIRLPESPPPPYVTPPGSISRHFSVSGLLAADSNASGNSGGSSAASTSSTPCGTFRRSMRKLSVCARDRYLGKTSTTVGSMVGSYEKLSNGELETAIRRHLHDSEPTSIDLWSERGGVGGNYRRYSSCDLESLYEGIRILDGFLARRGLTVSHPRRKKSVTVMLFGTPEHGPIHRRRRTQGIGNEQAAIREIGRVSRLSLDAAAFN
ncbi:Neuropilin and tolloid protein [Apis cerana cerana]|uniref:Neuropilin and tolloid protein n=1 Tax=Apis cerana cerana TaxID=94128 RepID=A0A2A3EML8_APICC|nr:Neuropilin and tolloid protein [Apis cerana cerana]